MWRGIGKGLITGSFGCVSSMHLVFLDDSGIFDFTKIYLVLLLHCVFVFVIYLFVSCGCARLIVVILSFLCSVRTS